MDFGTLKNNFTNALIESHLNGDESGKVLYKKFLKTIKESESLRSYFIVYKNIENKTLNSEFEANEYLKENLKVLDRFRGELSVSFELVKLTNILKESGVEINQTPSELHKSLSNLLNLRNNVNNIDFILESKSTIVKWLVSDKDSNNDNDEYVVEGIDPNKFLDIAVGKFNQKYSTLTEEEKNIFRIIKSSDSIEKKTLFMSMVKESISLINKTLKEHENNIDVKAKLLEVKDVIYNIEFDEETYTEDISKIYDLKNSLS